LKYKRYLNRRYPPWEVEDEFNYNPETGFLTKNGRRIFRKNRESERFLFRLRPLTHIIWYLQYGNFPPKGYVIDHKDNCPFNNKLENLQLLTTKENVKKGTTIDRLCGCSRCLMRPNRKLRKY
jgi:hypothetical protein